MNGMMPVLIVEDERATTELEQVYLTRAGLAARVVGRAEEAVALLTAEKFSAVVLDYGLPGGGAWTVVETAHRAIPRIPVVIVTGMGNEALAADAMQHGVEGFVTKTGDYIEHLSGILERAVKCAAMSAQLSRLASIVSSSDDAITSKTLEGDFLTWNPGAERIYGYTEAEIVGRNVALLIPPDGLANMNGVFENVKKGQGVDQFESVRLRKDGRRIDVALTVSSIKDAEGRVIGISCVARDISERKRAESLLMATLHSTADGILVVDRDGAITRYNRRFLDMWRIPAALAALGDDQKVLAFVVDQLTEPEVFLAKIEELYADPEAESFDTLAFKDGRFFERSSQPHRLGRDCVGRVWSFHDITELKRTEGALKAKIEELERLNEIMLNREERIIELKEQVASLTRMPREAGRP